MDHINNNPYDIPPIEEQDERKFLTLDIYTKTADIMKYIETVYFRNRSNVNERLKCIYFFAYSCLEADCYDEENESGFFFKTQRKIFNQKKNIVYSSEDQKITNIKAFEICSGGKIKIIANEFYNENEEGRPPHKDFILTEKIVEELKRKCLKYSSRLNKTERQFLFE